LPARSIYYHAAADICDQEINSRLRRVVVSVRDSATLDPVRAKVELEVEAPSPEEILKPYLSGDLLEQAVERATPYARGKAKIEAKDEANPITIYAPSTIRSYKVTAPGYEEAAGNEGRVKRGPLLFLLKKKLVD
jgi:hypothetical protein